MKFEEVLGQEHIKNHLIKTTDIGRIPHAQLFVGKEGCGTLPLAIAYAFYVLYGKNESNYSKFGEFSHPDLHFIYPTIVTDNIKKPKSTDFLPLWREFLKENPYRNLFDWYKKMGNLSKNGEIRVEDAQSVLKTLWLKSFQGGYKVLIIWQADKMNNDCANKLLKIIEEPPQKTLIILVTEKQENILQTIKSRCQAIYIDSLSEEIIAKKLVSKYSINENIAKKIAHQSQGNINKAIEILQEKNEFPFDKWFVRLNRNAFKIKKYPNTIIDYINWTEEIAKVGKETQKKFFLYCIDVFRQALLLNYNAENLLYIEPDEKSFNDDKFTLRSFSPFVNEKNIHEIFNELSEAIYHIERNGNVKIILTDLSMKITRLIYKK